MALEIKGLSALRERLERLRVEEVMAQALAAQAERVADAVRQRLSETPGTGGHDEPWRQSGALRDSVGAEADGLQAVVGSSDPAAVPQEMGTAHMPPRPFLAPTGAGMGQEVARGVAEAVVAALKGEPEEGAVILAGVSTSGQTHSVPYDPLGVFVPGSPENEDWTHGTIQRLRDLGHIFHSEGQDGEGQDEGRPPEKGADPVKPTFKPNDAHNPRNQNHNPNKDPEPPDSEEVYKDARRDPNPDKRVWYGKNAKGEWYQYREDGTGTAHYAGTIKRERVPIEFRRSRK